MEAPLTKSAEGVVPVSIIFKQVEFSASVAIRAAEEGAAAARKDPAEAFGWDELIRDAEREMRAVFSALYFALADAGLDCELARLTALRDAAIDRIGALRAETRAQATAFIQSGFDAARNANAEHGG